jgi:glycine cleavage system H lipoate-binding protein
MFPWIYGFHWNPVHIVFVGVFLTVALVVATTLVLAAIRRARAMRPGKVEEIVWEANFEDLPARDRACRHALTGEAPGRVCENAFQCGRCASHPVFERLRSASPAEDEPEFMGLPLPPGRAYHRGHTWVETMPDGTVKIGLDPIAARLAGSGGAVDLPAPGRRLRENTAAFFLNVQGSRVRVLAPVSGEVLETAAPGQDWLLRLRPEPGASFAHLLRGREVVRWLTREMERLQILLSTRQAQAALADGGVPVDDFPASCPEIDWAEVSEEMLLES